MKHRSYILKLASKTRVYRGVGALFFCGIFLTSVTFAAWTDTKSSGDPILATDWNAMVQATWDGSNGNVYRATGNVGIGTTDPNRSLQVNDAAGDAYLQMTSFTSGTTATDGLELSIGTDASIWNYETGFLRFGTANVERMRIDSSGNVGIGTSSIDSNAKLHVLGGRFKIGDGTQENHIEMDSLVAGWNYISAVDGVMNIRTRTTSPMVFSVNDDEKMRIIDGGNVGIGTTSPEAMLTVGGENGSGKFVVQADNGSNWFSVGETSGQVIFNSQGGRTEVGNSGDLGARVNISTLSNSGSSALAITGVASPTANLFEVNSIGDQGGDYFLIDKDGNVGIGTTSPEVLLHMTGTSAKLEIEDTDDGFAQLFLSNSGASGSNYGIGMLKFRGINNNSNDFNYTRIMGAMSNDEEGSEGGYLTFATAGSGTLTDRVIIDENGNVGIGATTPGAKLEVDGLIIPDKVTADPCSSGAPEGGIFYNDTANYWCGCDGTNDVQLHDPTVACF